MKPGDTQDILGGLGLSALGLFAAVYAQRYEIGDLSHMGPGYLPLALGVTLCILGLSIAVPAFFRHEQEPVSPAWKSAVLVLGSIVVFAIMLQLVGLVLATTLSVLVASLADNETRWKGRLIIAASVAVVTWLVFGISLGLSLPIWPWNA